MYSLKNTHIPVAYRNIHLNCQERLHFLFPFKLYIFPKEESGILLIKVYFIILKVTYKFKSQN